MKAGDRVSGIYGGVKFSGVVRYVEPNWENGSFARSDGVHVYVDLDNMITGYMVGRFKMNDKRASLMFEAWVSGKTYENKELKLLESA